MKNKTSSGVAMPDAAEAFAHNTSEALKAGSSLTML